MSADIVDINAVRIERASGNGAREALTEMVKTFRDKAPDYICWADWVLSELWARGFKVVPIDDGEKT